MHQPYPQISITEFLNIFQNKQTAVIDIRPVDAYNGWRMQDEKRGGHITGARSLPHKWISYIDWIEIVRSKGIAPEQDIIIYGYDSQTALEVAVNFEKAGYQKISIFNHFKDWAEDDALPLEALPKYHHLVPPEWLHEKLTQNKLHKKNHENMVVCHAHYRNPDDYAVGHIPGAIALDTRWLEADETWNRRSPEELEDVFKKLGITADSTVVLYGRFSYPRNEDPFPGSSAGHLGAIRCAFIMLYAGIKDVKVLNGGLRSWTDAGFETTKVSVEPTPITNFGVKIPARPELVVDTPEAKKMLASANAELVSVRSWREFIGEVSGYNYIEKTGRIPGAVFGNCGLDAYHMDNYRNLDHTTKEYHEIQKNWEEADITPDKHIAFYCGTGWRGSEAFFNAFLMGWPKISVYDGGWFEWSNDPKNPIEKGIPE